MHNGQRLFRLTRTLAKITTFLFLSASVFLGSGPVSASAATDWSQPPIGCVEEMVPHTPDRPCLDLSQLPDPLKDLPVLSPDESVYWQSNKRPLQYCRAAEILRRESAQPGSQSAGRIESAWMQTLAVKNRSEKLAAVEEASRLHKVPGQVLTGALYQESLFSELGIAEDGANFSCGVGQVNLSEWCRWAERQSRAKKRELSWPEHGVSCSSVEPALIRPFFEIAKTRLKGLPEYRLQKSHFANIGQGDVEKEWPTAPADVQEIRYQVSRSFIDNCSVSANGISAKANELAALFAKHVPAGLRNRERYAAGERFNRQCQIRGSESYYPLHTGWLLAVGIYNAGPRAVETLAHYNQWRASDLAKVETFAGMAAPDLVEAFYWSGRYRPDDDRLHITTLAGRDVGLLWFKNCVLQRHIARVVQHVTLPNTPPLADTLEGSFKCAKSVFDPSTGELIRSAVPPRRQTSTGTK